MAALGARPHPNLNAELDACLPMLERYRWPGNVRELRNLMERLALFLANEPLQALTPAFLQSIAPELRAQAAPEPPQRAAGGNGRGSAGALRRAARRSRRLPWHQPHYALAQTQALARDCPPGDRPPVFETYRYIQNFGDGPVRDSPHPVAVTMGLT